MLCETMCEPLGSSIDIDLEGGGGREAETDERRGGAGEIDAEEHEAEDESLSSVFLVRKEEYGEKEGEVRGERGGGVGRMVGGGRARAGLMGRGGRG